ncbi:NUDIX hydrolase [Pseudonocardia xinjiangensis]|uniref:NUDIX hydrolase n=1 Tax=Pseudonocardia xinjiangensis TaxID=75289 RepID=UPI003D92E82C
MDTTSFGSETAGRSSERGSLGAERGPGPGAVPPPPSPAEPARAVHFHDPRAPSATTVVPSVFVAARNPLAQLLLVRRCDSGSWELPGGRVDVGESAMSAGVRETAEEAGVQAQITGLVGIYTDPAHVVRAVDGSVRQQFVVVLQARAVGGTPAPDGRETCEAKWVAPRHVRGMPIDPPVLRWIDDALHEGAPPRLA